MNEFIIIEFLSAVKTRIARKHIRYADDQRIIGETVRSEKLNGQQERCKGAVGNTAENRSQSHSSPEGVGKSQQAAEKAAESSAYVK